jgi:hypothetical protein
LCFGGERGREERRGNINQNNKTPQNKQLNNNSNVNKKNKNICKISTSV